jgi:hypothetical protein
MDKQQQPSHNTYNSYFFRNAPKIAIFQVMAYNPYVLLYVYDNMGSIAKETLWKVYYLDID